MSTDFENKAAQEFHITVTNIDLTAVQLLAEASNLSVQEIKQAMQKGCVWLTRGKTTQRQRRVKKSLKQGDEIHMYFNPQVLSQSVEDAKLISDAGSYSIWYKPYAMLCLGSKWSDHTTINRFVETHLKPQRPAFIVHRLDKATTGLLVIAHSKSTARALSQAFAERKTEKHYQAIVHGDFNSQLKAKNDTLIINSDIETKTATTHVSCLEYNVVKNQSLLDIKIDTGRKHQIRIHLSSIGFPIVGDRLYGNDEKLIDGQKRLDLQLNSVYLKIPNPDTLVDMEYFIDVDLKLSL
ncbi:MAG: RNA pseudouridine synthase [Saccharospirillaceae bacterium]|nr:RNA pseudouridine synthase [Pseudomonadales bacterium]NRB78675.1 RNA pseudouridine synthase [Saccharospirillaceae bacterium]